jgi:hypothetical protein
MLQIDESLLNLKELSLEESQKLFVSNQTAKCFITDEYIIVDNGTHSRPEKYFNVDVCKRAVEYQQMNINSYVHQVVEDYLRSGKCHCSEITVCNSSNYDGGELCIIFNVNGKDIEFTTDNPISFTKEGFVVFE